MSSIPDDPEQAARRLRRHFQGERWEALVRARAMIERPGPG